jgi:hypothetical protein
VFEANMAACGMQVVRFHVPASWWFGDTTGLSRRDYELGAYAWVGQADPASAQLYACDYIPRPENGWAGQNSSGWCNETGSNALKNGDNTLDRQARIDNYAIAQEEFAKDMPVLPLFNRVETTATAADFENFRSAPGMSYQSWNAHEWVLPGRDTIVLAFSQEPASLFALVENAFVAVHASTYIFGLNEQSENYDFQPVLLKSVPTLENGGTVMNTVEVKEGDTVVDATGSPVPLAAGVKVKDVDGNEVEFTGTPIKMPQLVITSPFLDGTTFSRTLCRGCQRTETGRGDATGHGQTVLARTLYRGCQRVEAGRGDAMGRRHSPRWGSNAVEAGSEDPRCGQSDPRPKPAPSPSR